MVKALFSLALGLYEMRIKAHPRRPRGQETAAKVYYNKNPLDATLVTLILAK